MISVQLKFINLKNILIIISLAILMISQNLSAQGTVLSDPVDIGSRLELFVDNYLIKDLSGKAKLRLHHPEPKEIVITFDAPWEGAGSGYVSIFQDGDAYKMYYKAWQHPVGKFPEHDIVCGYAESIDGIHWQKPNLGLYEFNGSKNNNIVFIRGIMNGVYADGGHPAVFKDENPNLEPDARYKAILRAVKPTGLFAFKSPDGFNWKVMSPDPIITDGAFDSQNLAFWDSENKEYRAYWRYFDKETEESRYQGTRGIRTAVSKDMVIWDEQNDLKYVDSPNEELYTNQIKPYYRAPHLLIGFPTRYIDRGWSESMRSLPELEEREYRASIHEKSSQRYGTAVTESLIMVSRDGVNFKRWNEAFLRPGIERKGTWNYGQQYLAWSIVETKSDIQGAPNELSLYAIENYWTGTSCDLRRYTLRIDGFVSVNAPMSGGELITKTLTFTGNNLILNFSSSAAGSIQVEIQDENGNPISGFSLDDCDPLFGDTLERAVTWKGINDLSSLEGKPIRLRFVLRDADLFSLRFR